MTDQSTVNSGLPVTKTQDDSKNGNFCDGKLVLDLRYLADFLRFIIVCYVSGEASYRYFAFSDVVCSQDSGGMVISSKKGVLLVTFGALFFLLFFFFFFFFTRKSPYKFSLVTVYAFWYHS